MTKMTYVQALDNAINGNFSIETMERLSALRETLAKRATAERKPTKAQKEAESFREKVREFVLDSGAASFTVKEIATGLEASPQKVTAALTALVKDGSFVKGDGWYEVAQDEGEGE